MGAPLGCDTRPMSVKRRRAIAEADAEDARRWAAETYAPDPGRWETHCPHGLPACKCDGNPHSIVGRRR